MRVQGLGFRVATRVCVRVLMRVATRLLGVTARVGCSFGASSSLFRGSGSWAPGGEVWKVIDPSTPNTLSRVQGRP